jgi:hypothetical protein
MNNDFYMNYAEGQGAPTVKYKDKEVAEKEATRLAEKLGVQVITLKSVTAIEPKDITKRVKSYEDACRELGIKPIDTRVSNQVGDLILDDNTIAYMKLRTIVDALNEGWKPEFTEDKYRWYPWFYLYTQEELDDMEDLEKKDHRIIDTGDYATEYAGFGSAYSLSAPPFTAACVGSRLCLRSSELAVYCGKQFIKLWADFNLIRK